MKLTLCALLGIVLLPALSCGAATPTSCVVAPDGTGDFTAIQQAIDAVPDGNATPFTISIKTGKYPGHVIVPKTKTHLIFAGESKDKTILSWDRNVNEPIPEGGDKFNPGLWVRADDFRATNMTIENTSGDHGQALAVRVDSDRASFENCRLLGWQDTLMVNNGRQYFKDCTIEGRVDFIYGSGTAVFEDCQIHSKNGGYITAASTPQEKPCGFVFLNCTLTGDPDPWLDPATGQPKPGNRPGALAYLGRPWRPYAQVAFINCKMGEHIRPEGWENWRNPENEKTARYVEFGSQTLDGQPLDVSGRVAWSKQFSAEEAAQYSADNVLGDWNPQTEIAEKTNE